MRSSVRLLAPALGLGALVLSACSPGVSSSQSHSSASPGTSSSATPYASVTPVPVTGGHRITTKHLSIMVPNGFTLGTNNVEDGVIDRLWTRTTTGKTPVKALINVTVAPSSNAGIGDPADVFKSLVASTSQTGSLIGSTTTTDPHTHLLSYLITAKTAHATYENIEMTSLDGDTYVVSAESTNPDDTSGNGFAAAVMNSLHVEK